MGDNVAASAHPRVFISYSWDDEGHKQWVLDLGERLRGDGVDVILDRWHLAPGDQLPEFMERGVRDSQFILIICTPNYSRKSNERLGGAGYEGTIMTAEIAANANHRKFIPLLRRGEWLEAASSWILGKKYIDFRGDPYSEASYNELLQTLHGLLAGPPPLGALPDKSRLTGTPVSPPSAATIAPMPAKRTLDQLPLKDRILVRIYDMCWDYAGAVRGIRCW